MTVTRKSLLAEVDRDLAAFREGALQELRSEPDGASAQLRGWIEGTLNRQVTDTELAEWQAQAVYCGALILSSWPALSSDRLAGIVRHASPLLQPLLLQAAEYAHGLPGKAGWPRPAPDAVMREGDCPTAG